MISHNLVKYKCDIIATYVLSDFRRVLKALWWKSTYVMVPKLVNKCQVIMWWVLFHAVAYLSINTSVVNRKPLADIKYMYIQVWDFD